MHGTFSIKAVRRRIGAKMPASVMLPILVVERVGQALILAGIFWRANALLTVVAPVARMADGIKRAARFPEGRLPGIN